MSGLAAGSEVGDNEVCNISERKQTIGAGDRGSLVTDAEHSQAERDRLDPAGGVAVDQENDAAGDRGDGRGERAVAFQEIKPDQAQYGFDAALG